MIEMSSYYYNVRIRHTVSEISVEISKVWLNGIQQVGNLHKSLLYTINEWILKDSHMILF